MITVLYFARLRETLGKGSEQIKLPAEVRDLEGLEPVHAVRSVLRVEQIE